MDRRLDQIVGLLDRRLGHIVSLLDRRPGVRTANRWPLGSEALGLVKSAAWI